MRVSFRRIGERRYDVLVDRDHAPQMIMHPAPGWDAYLPHDLLHFVAEAEWGIDDAVFGQLAAGGDAGTFWTTDRQAANKWKYRGASLRKTGHGMKRSEQLADALYRAWRRERTDIDPALVAKVDELAQRWHALAVGGSVVLEWPRPERRRRNAA
jgi:hypothetical protein